MGIKEVKKPRSGLKHGWRDAESGKKVSQVARRKKKIEKKPKNHLGEGNHEKEASNKHGVTVSWQRSESKEAHCERGS